MNPRPPHALLAFGDFVVDEAESTLRRGGELLDLPLRQLALLLALLRRAGQLVDKDTLLDEVWGTVHITEGVIKTAISELRVALGDDARQPRWIETVPRRGYRFVGAVQRLQRPAAGPEADPTHEPRTNLPAVRVPLIGRDRELAQLLALLPRQGLTTLVGPGGVGKTSLALAALQVALAASREPAWWVELAPLSAEHADLPLVCATMAHALPWLGPVGSVSALVQALQPARGLLLLDNAEHLLPLVQTLVQALRSGAPGWRLLVTSQVPLGVAGEQLLPLAPLPVPGAPDAEDAARLMQRPAVQLFVQRVAERMPGFALADRHLDAVVEICRSLDGLPLALELAAARVPLLGVLGLAERLRDGEQVPARLDWIRAPTRAAPERQRSLEQTVAWSVEMLDAPQRAALSAMAVFRCGLTLPAAMDVARRGGAASDAMAGDIVQVLVDRCLLLSTADGAGPPRLRMLEGVREFLLRKLQQQGLLSAAMDRLVQTQQRHWRDAEAMAANATVLAWAEQHKPELPNLRAALRWLDQRGEGRGLCALLADTANAWHRLSAQAEGRDWFVRGRERLNAIDDPLLRARFLASWAMQAAVAHLLDAQAVIDELPSLVATLRAGGELQTAAMAAHAAYHLGLRHGRPALRQQALQWQLACTLPGWGELALRSLRINRALEQRIQGDAGGYEQAMLAELEIARRNGATAEGWVVTQGLALAWLDQGRLAEAAELIGAALEDMRRHHMLAHYPALAGMWLLVMGRLQRTEALRDALAQLAPAFVGSGARFMMELPGAMLAALEGRHEDAARLLGRYALSQPLKPAAPGAAGPQQFTERVHLELHEDLGRRLGAAALESLLAQGRALPSEAATALALAGPGRS